MGKQGAARLFWQGAALMAGAAGGAGCGDDDGGTAADRIGVGAECPNTEACPEVQIEDETVRLSCIAQFRGGYCGIQGCQGDADCPEGSACVNHDDGQSYCFRVCAEKIECNRNRKLENEANCSSNIEFTDAARSTKACVPPSSG
jgi:hypothetical protein